MKKMLLLPFLFLYTFVTGQSVGIGTTTPNASSVLDLGSSAKPLILPRLSSAEMSAVTGTAQGMIIYNTDEHQLYSFMRYRATVPDSRWQPVSTGPRMLAWGVLDSFSNSITGSSTFSVTWDATNRWYRFSLASPLNYFKDSMLLMVTPVGNGSWDQAVSTGEIIEANRLASIKFTDVSRIAAGFSTLQARRKSGFHFILYDLRKEPY